MKMYRLLVAGCAAVFAAGVASNVMADKGEKGEQEHAMVGKAAPQFELKDIDGKMHKLSDYKGKVVVLEWTNCTCPFVKRHQMQKKTMQKTFAKFKGKDVVWLAVDSTHDGFHGDYGVEKMKEWANSKDVQLPYPVLRDADGNVGHLYGAKSTPHMFVIDQKGVLAYEGAIDDDPSGDAEQPTNFVEAAVTSLLEGSTVEVTHHEQYGCSIKYAKM